MTTADLDVKVLSASEIVGKEDFEYEDVDVPEWGGTVRIRVLSAAEAITFTDFMKGESKKNGMLKIVALCAVDADGNRLFKDDQLSVLGRKNLKVLMRLQDKALDLNGLRLKKKKDENENLEDAKND